MVKRRYGEVPGLDFRLRTYTPTKEHAVAWILLMGAIVLEVLGTTCMKLTAGFSRLWPTVGMVVAYAGSFGLMTLTLKSLHVSTAYAVWSGVGTALIAVIGMTALGEPFGWPKVAGISLIIGGVVMLNLGGAH
ncbi:MAG: small multidrug resistance protein [Streptosporangiaceae bacterium]|jgi:small multidrug resistance pump|nr:small multidrug resistance protein [Streptosporangiaceae bacterium]